MHHPALASQIEKAPPKATQPAANHQNVPLNTPARIKPVNINEPITAIIPNLNLAAFPFAPILHCI